MTAAGGWGEHVVDVDEPYLTELAERDRILAADPARFQALPHMEIAQWDAMLTIMRSLAASYPRVMSLERDGGIWRWTNHAIDLEQAFVHGERATLPEPPLRFIGRQIQEDVVLLDQREGQLWGDAGLVTFAADWSLRFDVGMSFLQIHGPVPRIHAEGVVTRAQSFLMRLYGTAVPADQLDAHGQRPRHLHRDEPRGGAGPAGARGRSARRGGGAAAPAGGGAAPDPPRRLGRDHVPGPHPHAAVHRHRAGPRVAQRLHAVLSELPDDMAEYKGITRIRQPGIDWLARYGVRFGS